MVKVFAAVVAVGLLATYYRVAVWVRDVQDHRPRSRLEWAGDWHGL